ncbi:B12-binding domain-containing radical SAM protein [candidate division KSB1 bacterium]|nr:MAG: B12-binding domain-containing radical SAM protein [candidate division KSB1 bacterium]
MKVSLIEPQPVFNGYSFAHLPSAGLLILGTILKKKGFDVLFHSEVYGKIFKGRKIKHIEKEILNSDVVGITAMTSTAPRAYEIASIIKNINKKIKIVMGGSHISFMPEEALNYADSVVIGEADEIITDIIEGKISDRIIAGSQIEDLDSLPFIDYSMLEGKGKRIHYKPFITSRGCPYNCTFCTVTSLFGRKYRFRSPDNVIEELKFRIKRNDNKYFFYDDNFTANKTRTKIILEKSLMNNLEFNWIAQVRTDVAKDKELLELSSRTNCSLLFIGLESINPDTLRDYNKRQTVDDIKECIHQLKKHKIRICGMFVLGSDSDDISTIDETVKFCLKMNLDYAQFAILSPFPGTKLYSMLSRTNRIFSKDWSLYDGTHIVFKPSKISPIELQRKLIWAWKRFYTAARIGGFLYSRYIINRWKKLNRNFIKMLERIKTVNR